jgi:hypothetical protein
VDGRQPVIVFGQKMAKRRRSFVKREYSVMNFILNKICQIVTENCVFFRSVSPHSCLLATHLLRVSLEKSRQFSRNLPRDARHKSSIRELKKKNQCQQPT